MEERSYGFRVEKVRTLSVSVTGTQLIFKMSSENQTVDYTNKIMGNDHDTIFVCFRTAYITV